MKSRMDEALVHAKNRAELLSHCSMEYIIHISAKELGIPSDSDGAEYVRNAARVLCISPGKSLTKGVYLMVGMMSEEKAGADQVRIAIASCIRNAWEERDEDVWACYFPVGRPGRTECPSNLEFLMAIVDYVKIWKAFCEEVNYAE